MLEGKCFSFRMMVARPANAGSGDGHYGRYLGFGSDNGYSNVDLIKMHNDCYNVCLTNMYNDLEAPDQNLHVHTTDDIDDIDD